MAVPFPLGISTIFINNMQNMQNIQNMLYMQAYKGTKTQRKARLHRTVALVGRA